MTTARTACRYGTMNYFADDQWLGKAFEIYGEFSEAEIDSHRMMLRPGDRVVCVGANIGAMVIPIGQMVAPTGRVYAFEPRDDAFEVLLENVVDNDLSEIVTCYELACSDRDGTIKVKSQDWNKARSYEVAADGDIEVPCCRLDTVIPAKDLDCIKLLQIDVEGHEIEVLRGAEQLITGSRGFLYLENDRKDRSQALIAYLAERRYRMWWHHAPMYNPDNFKGYKSDIFGNCCSFNMVCVPEESTVRAKALDEVADVRLDEQMFDREIARYRRINELHPDDLAARLLTAHFCNLMQREAEAWPLLEENLRQDPEHIGTLAIRGLMRMQRGDYDWEAYELRYRQANAHIFGNRPHHGERWDGRATDAPVLLWNEQGFGDSIMFARFFDDVLARAPNAFVEVQPALYELFTESFPHISFYRTSRGLPDYRYHCSLPSLPHALKVGNDVWRPTPYLKVNAGLVKVWQRRPHPRIGVCCKGSPLSERPYTRDFPEHLLQSIFPLERPVSLENKQIQFYNFAETAALMKDLDVVITVDTAIAHLGGALDVPTWLLLSLDPDWRWGLKSDRTVWYDSVRIFRAAKVLDWTDVLEQLKGALDEQRRLDGGQPHSDEISGRSASGGTTGKNRRRITAAA